jgi:hypothetical protein
MSNGIGIAAVLDGVRSLRRGTGTALRAVGALALALLATGIAVPATAQTITLSNQVFPVTQVGQTPTTQTVTLTSADDILLKEIRIDSPSGEFTLNRASGTCIRGLALTAGGSCTLSISFAPQLPGYANAPAPIGRSAPLVIGYYDQDLSLWQKITLALSGTGTGPVAVLSPGLIGDLVGSETASQGYGGDGGPAAKALFNSPLAMTVDGLGNIYIADTNNGLIRVVYKGGAQLASLIALVNPGTTATAGSIYTIAGVASAVGSSGASPDGVLATQSFLYSPKALRWMERGISTLPIPTTPPYAWSAPPPASSTRLLAE